MAYRLMHTDRLVPHSLPPLTSIAWHARSFYLLRDVLRATELSEEDFTRKHPQVDISRISNLDLAKATLSEVDHSDGDESSVIFQSSSIDEILHISSTVIT